MADNTGAKKISGLFPAAPAQSERHRKTTENRYKQLAFIIVTLLCCVGSFYFFRSTLQLMADQQTEQVNYTPEPDVEAVNETRDIAKTSTELTSMDRTSTMAMQTALLAEISGKYPVAPANALIPRIPVEIAEPDQTEDIVVEPEPPQVAVVAILVTGEDRIAMIDILGEETGLIVRQGSQFSNNTAKITRIDAKGVTFTWMGKTYEISM